MFDIGDRVRLLDRDCGDTWEHGDVGEIVGYDDGIWEVRLDSGEVHDVYYGDQMELV